MKWKMVLCIVLSVLLIIPAMQVPVRAAQQPVLGVALTEGDLPVYAQPQPDSPVVTTTLSGQWVVILAAEGEWYQVSYNLQTGYLPQQSIQLRTVENVELGFGEVCVPSVNLRQGPSTDYRVSTVAQSGDRCYILGINQGWYKVLYGGKVAYIRSDYLNLTEIPYENLESPLSPQFFRWGEPMEDPVQALTSELLQSAIWGADGSVVVSQDTMEQMQQVSPGRAALWKAILHSWSKINQQFEIGITQLPEGLPQDNSLCIMVFGYALNSDGTPARELIHRLEVALSAAQQYPNAYILCTGGGTAENSSATEAGVMADWLVAQGIAPERILQENRSMSTTANAQRSFALLKNYPQIQSLALVSSDYHIRRCAVVFETVSLYQSACAGRKPVEVLAIASYPEQGSSESLRSQAREIARITSVPF